MQKSTRCLLVAYFFCLRYFSKTQSNPAKKITGQCFSTEMKAACKNSANLEQETETTKIVTYPLFPLVFSNVNSFKTMPKIKFATFNISQEIKAVSNVERRVILPENAHHRVGCCYYIHVK